VAPLAVVATCGVCVGFLPHNFSPAKVFMGDAGAMLLGLLMAAATISVGGRTADQFSGQTYFFFAPLFIPFFILGVPIVDTGFAIVRRAARRASVSEADKEHLHHRLMQMGHGPRRSVLILWAWTAVLCGVVLVPTFTNKGNALVPFLVAGLGVLLFTFFHPGVRQPPPARLFDQEAPWAGAPSGELVDPGHAGEPLRSGQADRPPAAVPDGRAEAPRATSAARPAPGHLRPPRPVP
jgi:UDP-GlcNAc:undecaprenyl-phosphate/decaprenyl-phosphate GlcNAc-1-phosphate transferase